MQISEYFSLQIKRTKTIIQHEKVYRNKTHFNMLIYQILQQKISDDKLKKPKDEMKGSFHGTGCVIEPIF